MTAIEIIKRKARFMRIKANQHKIYMFICKHGLSNGVSWHKSKKSDMAEAYAEEQTFNSKKGLPVLPESTIELLEAHFGAPWLETLNGVALVSIGPQTSERCRSLLQRLDAEADPHDLEGLVAACGRALTS
jgi:uroporphyrinogen-III synthase